MKKRYEDGGEIDAMEEANNRSEMTPRRVSLPPRGPKEMGDASAAEAAGQFGDAGTSRVVKATPKAAPKPTAKPAPKLIDPSNIRSGRRSDEESQMAPADKTKMSVSERAKASRESARAGSGTTDRRSVGERLKSAFGMKSGGSVGSASRRADGIATKGKTRGRMC
jgi:hypothetical protein